MTVAPQGTARTDAPGRAELSITSHDTARATKWLRRLGRRLFVLDFLLVAVAIARALVPRFGSGAPRVQVTGALGRVPVTSYAALAIALIVGWLAMLYSGRTYDARVI